MSIPYPIKFSILGDTKTGKTDFAMRFPNAYLIDFCDVSMGVQEIEIKPTKEYGESYFTVLKRLKNNKEEMARRYKHVKSYDDYDNAIKDALVWKEYTIEQAEKTGKKPLIPWIVLDDTRRWHGHMAYHWIQMQLGKTRKSGKDITFPSQKEWGIITQWMNAELNRIGEDFHLVLIHQMKDEYIADVSTGERVAAIYPNGVAYGGDISGKLWLEHRKGKPDIRHFTVEGNRFVDPCCEERVVEFVNPDPVDVLMKCEVPRECL